MSNMKLIDKRFARQAADQEKMPRISHSVSDEPPSASPFAQIDPAPAMHHSHQHAVKITGAAPMNTDRFQHRANDQRHAVARIVAARKQPASPECA